MTDHTKKRRFRSPLNIGIEWLESRPPLNAAYNRVALWIAIIGVIVGSMASIGVALGERARGRDRDALLACFDRYATDLSGSLPAVREASQARNEALANVLIGDDAHLGLGLLIYRAQQGIKSDPKKDLADLAETFLEFQKADQHLLEVQRDNPYPDAPTELCEKR